MQTSNIHLYVVLCNERSTHLPFLFTQYDTEIEKIDPVGIQTTGTIAET